MKSTDIPPFRKALQSWYRAGARAMPWRDTTDPYKIWLSEVMLQQTTVATVIPYYQRFLKAFPTIHHLASATQEDVLHHWQGLGYYRRARLLHRCAQTIVAEHNGTFPATIGGLKSLAGIGDYTAHAIAAFAFNAPAAVVDGNVERVLTRLTANATPLPRAKKTIAALAQKLADPANSRTYNNAIMELGATVCTPANPQCTACPVAQFCAACQQGNPTAYPVKAPKKKLPHHHGTAYIATDPEGNLYLRQRGENTLLGSLWEVPHEGWEAMPPPFQTNESKPLGTITHTFTHFKLTLSVHHLQTTKPHPKNHAFTLANLPPMPTLMRKALALLPPS